jgi:ATP-dependent Clp endopeptidase proteolytic subunit ClpP
MRKVHSNILPERRLQIIGEITDKSYKKFSKKLYELETSGPTEPITIELNSEGGEAIAALAYSARIRRCKTPIIIITYGQVASAAVLILASGETRLMSREAWVMVHEETDTLEGTTTDLEKKVKHMRRLENQWNKLLAEYTTTDAEHWDYLALNETHLCARECLDLGLVDEII